MPSKRLIKLSGFLCGGLLLALAGKTLAIAPASVAPTSLALINYQPQVNVWQAIVLGMVQGLTEFLPISSTAHLKVIPLLFGWGDPGVSFTAVIQLGSIGAVLWYFWADLRNISLGAYQAIKKQDYQSFDFKLALGIGLGTIPILLGGIFIKLFVPDFDDSPLRSVTATATASIVMAILLGIAEKIGQRKREFQQLTLQDGLLMGLAEALAIIPGVSRSGSTMTAGLFMGLTRETAARFSFLLGIPAITIAGLVELKDLLESGLTGISPLAVVLGLISAAFFSYLSIAWLLKFLQTQNTWVFVWYRLLFGISILILVKIGWLL
ncbi:MAG: undecaprenyl-diphosphate phosphatase [Microcoleaceae cyanobacterium]